MQSKYILMHTKVQHQLRNTALEYQQALLKKKKNILANFHYAGQFFADCCSWWNQLCLISMQLTKI